MLKIEENFQKLGNSYMKKVIFFSLVSINLKENNKKPFYNSRFHFDTTDRLPTKRRRKKIASQKSGRG